LIREEKERKTAEALALEASRANERAMKRQIMMDKRRKEEADLKHGQDAILDPRRKEELLRSKVHDHNFSFIVSSPMLILATV
jgi:hypothetical protein